MEDKCFQEGCEQEAFLLCKCTDPPTGVCELHFPEHLRKNRFGIHNHLILKVYVDPSDCQEVIEVLESHKRNIYTNMQKLAHVTKQLHLSIEAEFAKELNELRKREMEIQKLIEELSDLTEFRTDRENPILFDLFSNESARKAERLNRYKELSRVFDLSSLKKSCDQIFSQNAHLNYSATNFDELISDDKVYQFSTDSSTLITYNLSTMQKTEKFLEGDLLGASVKCVLPDGRLFCYKETGQKWFLFNIISSSVSPLGPCNVGSPITLLDDTIIHVIGINQSPNQPYRVNQYPNQTYQPYHQFNLKTMKWNLGPDLNEEKRINIGDNYRYISLVSFEGKIYATTSNSQYVYMYSRESGSFIEIFRLGNGFKFLFEGRNRLFLLCGNNPNGPIQSGLTLYHMEPSSKKFLQLKQCSFYCRFSTPSYTKKLGNSLYFCSDKGLHAKLDLETYEITEQKFPEATI